MAATVRGGGHGQFTIPSKEDYNNLPDELKARVTEAIDLFDTNKDGWQSYEEFRFTLRALGFSLPKAQTYDLLLRHGVKPPSWGEKECPAVWRIFSTQTVQAIAGTLMANRDPYEEARRAYKLFDVDGKGMITTADLARVCRTVGNNMSETEIEAMIEEFDANGKGGVDENEFVRIMTRAR